MIEASSPGKLMLFGEHAAVYKKPCIGIAIDKRMYVSIEKIPGKKTLIDAPDINIINFEYKGKIEEPTFVCAAIKNFEDKTGIKVEGVKLTTRSDIDLGFGTSSTSTVSTLGALNEYFETNLSKEDIFKLGYKTILDVQGKGSGYDVAAAVYGGIFRYIKGETPEPITNKEFPFVIGYTGIKVKTVPLVEKVKRLYEENKNIIGSIFDQMEALSNEATRAMKRYDLERIGELMNINHGLLYTIGVSSKILEEMVFTAREAGAVGAKLCGAGVGDYMISLCPGKEKEVKEALNKTKGEAVEARMAIEGLRIVHK